MKIVKNTSMQGFSVPFTTPNGVIYRFISPKQTINIPDSWGGKVLDNLVKRRMFKVRLVKDSSEEPKPVIQKHIGVTKTDRQENTKKSN